MRRRQLNAEITAVSRELSDAATLEIIAMAREWALHDEELIGEMREALTQGDHERALRTARELCGLEKKVTS
jgi:hypothetical protein